MNGGKSKPLQLRHWIFVLNNPTLFESTANVRARFEKCPHFRYGIFQLEKGASGTPHYQGYFEFSQPMRMAALKKLFYRANWRARKGTRDQARTYASKSKTKIGPCIEFGIWNPKGAGNRSDLQAVVDLIAAQSDLRTVVTSHPTVFIKYHRGIEKLFQYYKPPRSGAIRVILLFGPTRSGKTFDTYEKWGSSLYRKNCTNKWFDRYQGEETLLLDDFGPSREKLPVELLLTVLDQYSPLYLEIKSGTIELLSKVIVVTSNLHPKLWYPAIKDETYLALGERFSEVHWYKSRDERFQLNSALFFNGWTEDCDLTRYIMIPETPWQSMDTAESEEGEDEDQGGTPATVPTYLDLLSDSESVELDKL